MLRSLIVLSFLLDLSFAASLLDNFPNTIDNPIVEIESGKILGQKLVSLDEDRFPYLSFQSIPYAEPPLGKNRFQPPRPKKNWDGILNATNEASMCLQPKVLKDAGKSSEDCLYLNVYTPNLKGSYSVMVWIYGGAFLAGSGAKAVAGPDYLIKENVVIVTLNYRVGIFGFLSTQDNITPGNYGLKDQIFALKWVQKNIRAFGGNPDDVTIFGESAGSASVSLLLQAKPARGLFHGAVMESGVSLSLFSRTRSPLDLAITTAQLLNISTTDTQELVDQLRMIDADQLLEASFINDVETTLVTNPRDGLLFAPSLEPPNEDAVLTQASYEQLNNGDFNIVPVIVGYNSAEGNPFETALSALPLFLMQYDLDHRKLVPIDMNVNESRKQEVGSKIKSHYFGLKTIMFQLESTSKFITDDQFIRPTNEFVRLVSKYANVFYYQFSYVGNQTGASRKLPGVGHGEDVAYLWRTKASISREDEPVRKKLVKLWTNFAKYKNPTPNNDPILENIIWPSSDAQNFPYLDIDSRLEIKTNPHARDIEFWSNLYNTYGNPPYDTY